MRIERRKIDGLIEIVAPSLPDARGYFQRLFDAAIWREAGLNTVWAQESISHIEIFNSARFNQIRRVHAEGRRAQLPMCRSCGCEASAEGKEVWPSGADKRPNPG